MIDKNNIKTVAVEDLMTWTIYCFLEMAENLGWDPKTDIREWYTSHSADDLYAMSSKIIDHIEAFVEEPAVTADPAG